MLLACLLILICLNAVSLHALSLGDYDILPVLPGQEKEQEEEGRSLVRYRGLGSVALGVGQSIGVGAASFIGYRLARGLLQGLLSRTALGGRGQQEEEEEGSPRANTFVKLDSSQKTLSEIRSEQEELWSCVAGIHAAQKEQQQTLEALRSSSSSSSSTDIAKLASTLAAVEEKLNAIIADLDSVKIRMQAFDSSQLEELRQAQEEVVDQVQSQAREVARVKEETSRALQDYQNAILGRLAVFKEDLKKVIARGRPR
eukprot:gene6256-6897_t